MLKMALLPTDANVITDNLKNAQGRLQGFIRFKSFPETIYRFWQTVGKAHSRPTAVKMLLLKYDLQ